MTQQAGEPNAEQLTIWRNLLDTFGQLRAAWDVAVRAQQNAEPGEGPGTVHMPEEMVQAFAQAGGNAAGMLEGLAQLLSEQPGHPDFRAVAEADGEARRRWAAVHEQLDPSTGEQASGAAPEGTAEQASTSSGA